MELPIDYEKTLSTIFKKKIVRGTIIATAIALNLSPILCRDILNKNAKLALSFFGCGFAIACCRLPKYDHEEKLKKTYQETDIKLLSTEINGVINYHRTTQEIQNKRNLGSIIERLPEHQIDAFAAEYGVTSILPQYYIEADNDQEPQRQPLVISSDPLRPTIYTEPEADFEWLNTVAYQFTRPQGQRLIEHVLVAGESQSGKSTLIALLLSLIHGAYDHQGLALTINLIDPKYPMSDTAYEPSWKGYGEVMEGMRSAIAELRQRKKTAREAKKLGASIPVFDPYLTILDELDTCYGGGKGYGSDISKDDAVELIGMIKQILNEGAAYNVRFFGIGQSPLSGDNGLSRAAARQAVRIILGDVARAWCTDPQFPFKKLAGDFHDYLQGKLLEGKRVAMVVMGRGEPLVTEIGKISFDKSPGRPDATTQATPEVTPQASPESTNKGEQFDKVFITVLGFLQAHPEKNSPENVRIIWESLTGKPLGEIALNYLYDKLQEKL